MSAARWEVLGSAWLRPAGGAGFTICFWRGHPPAPCTSPQWFFPAPLGASHLPHKEGSRGSRPGILPSRSTTGIIHRCFAPRQGVLGGSLLPHPLPQSRLQAPWMQRAPGRSWLQGNCSLLSLFHLLLPSWGDINSLAPSAAAESCYKAAHPPTLLPAAALVWPDYTQCCSFSRRRAMWAPTQCAGDWGGSSGFAQGCAPAVV